MVWAVGGGIRAWDHKTKPPKVKRHICVCPDKPLFVRINSEPLWPPRPPLRAEACDFLEHGSFIELQRLYAFHIQDAEKIGAINHTPNGGDPDCSRGWRVDR